jgi:hypothetical protein
VPVHLLNVNRELSFRRGVRFRSAGFVERFVPSTFMECKIGAQHHCPLKRSASFVEKIIEPVHYLLNVNQDLVIIM